MEENDRRASEADHAAIGALVYHSVSTLRHHRPVRDTDGHGMANTRHIPPAKYGWQNRFTDEEYNLVTSGQQLRMRSWPVRDSSRNAYSDFRPRIHEHLKAQVKFREDQRKFPLRRDTRSGGNTVHPNTDHSSNTGQILPERDRLQHRMREEYNFVMGGQQLRMRTWPVRDSSRTADFRPRIYEHPKLQEIKSREDQHQFLQRRDTRRGGDIMHPNAHHFYPNTRQILPARPVWQYCMTDEEYNLVMRGQQLRIGTWPARDSSRNAYSDFGPRIHEHPRVREVKFREDQRKFPLRRDTRSGGNIVHPNADHSSNTGQILPERDRLQHRMREEEYKLVMGRRQLRMRTWPMRDSNRNAESDVRPRVCENPPKEREIKFNEGLRRREMVNENIRNPNDHPIDGKARKPVPTQEPNPQGLPSVIGGTSLVRDSNRDAESDIRSRILEEPSEDHLMESNEFWPSGYRRRLTRIIEDYWSLLCTKRKAVWIGSLRIVCVLLLISVILFKILL